MDHALSMLQVIKNWKVGRRLETQKLIPSLVAASACYVSDNIDFCHTLSRGHDGLHNAMGTIQ